SQCGLVNQLQVRNLLQGLKCTVNSCLGEGSSGGYPQQTAQIQRLCFRIPDDLEGVEGDVRSWIKIDGRFQSSLLHIHAVQANSGEGIPIILGFNENLI